MTPQMEALEMLNKRFESRDGLAVDSAVITRQDFKQLFDALLSNQPEGGAVALLMEVVADRKEAIWSLGTDLVVRIEKCIASSLEPQPGEG